MSFRFTGPPRRRTESCSSATSYVHAAWRRTAIYNKWCRVVHIAPQATVALGAAGSPVERTLRVDLADDSPRTWGERERILLKLIRPSFMRPIALAEAVHERRRALGLTSRELAVLACVRDGMTNGEIAIEAVHLAGHGSLAPRARLRQDRRPYTDGGGRTTR